MIVVVLDIKGSDLQVLLDVFVAAVSHIVKLGIVTYVFEQIDIAFWGIDVGKLTDRFHDLICLLDKTLSVALPTFQFRVQGSRVDNQK